MSKSVLVTGAAGFIGFQTVRELLSQGYNVVGVDNMNDYYDPKLKEHRLNLINESKKFHFYREEIENISALKKIFKTHQLSAVINLAAQAGVRNSMDTPHIYMSTNAQGTLNLLECMREHDVKKFVLASTSSLYAGCEMPFKEDLPVNTPISPYAATKKAAEMMAYSYHHLYQFDVSVLRYFTVYGPAGRPDMSIFRFVKWIDEGTPITIYGDGSQSRDFTYVDDIARGTVAALKDVGYEIINLGGGKNPISLNTLIGLIEKELGKNHERAEIDWHRADMMTTHADISKAKEILGWTPTLSLQEGVKQTVAWYLENKTLCSQIKV